MEGSTLNIPRGYDNLHRLFLQHFMKKRMLTPEEAFHSFYVVCNSLHEDAPTQQDMEQAILLLNSAIKGLKMEIRTVRDEVTEQKYYAFIPTMSTSCGKLPTTYTASELEFFKRIVTEIFSAEDSAIFSTFCLNLNSSLPGKLSKSDLEKLIKRMCDDQWLVQKEGKIRLSALALAELEPQIKESYKDNINICRLCNHMVLQGYRCENCNSLFHSYCNSRYIKTLGNSDYSCPTCNEMIMNE